MVVCPVDPTAVELM